MDLNRTTALTLRAGVVLGMALMAVGLVMSCAGMSDDVLHYGILVLILSPFAGVVTSFICLVKEGDSYWAMVAGVLLAITVAGILISLRARIGLPYRFRRTVPWFLERFSGPWTPGKHYKILTVQRTPTPDFFQMSGYVH